MECLGFCVRIDAREGYLQKLQLLTFVEDYISLIGVQHSGTTKENPHYHLVIRTNMAQQTLRKRFRLMFDQGKGNGHMSIKTWDGHEHAVSYLFHEDPSAQLILRKNITDEFIDKCRQTNLVVQNEVKRAKEKASFKVEDIVRAELDPRNGYSDHQLCKKLYLAALRHGKYPPAEYKAKQMVARLQFELCEGNERAEERLAEAYVNSVYRYG